MTSYYLILTESKALESMNSKKSTKWPEESYELAHKLHNKLSINDIQWHRLKSSPERRAGELLSASLIKLINNGSTVEIQNLVEQALNWINGNAQDPGCPHN